MAPPFHRGGTTVVSNDHLLLAACMLPTTFCWLPVCFSGTHRVCLGPRAQRRWLHSHPEHRNPRTHACTQQEVAETPEPALPSEPGRERSVTTADGDALEGWLLGPFWATVPDPSLRKRFSSFRISHLPLRCNNLHGPHRGRHLSR